MPASDILAFGPFHLDLSHAQLWHEGQEQKLTAKAFAVLGYLATHPQRIVTKTELFAEVWPEVVVSDWALTTCVREIRRVLGDTAKTPRVIETVYRRGYRFIGEVVSSTDLSGVQRPASEVRNSQSAIPSPPPAIPLVGREAELTHLHTLLDKAGNGQRQLVFITGEPGIGKTALIDAFRWRLEAGDWRLAPSFQAPSPKPLAPSVSFAHGQCIERYGQSEAYLPVLEALGRLGRTAVGHTLKAVFTRYAPTWLLHLPALVSSEEALALQPRVLGTTSERMIRELVEALEVLTAERTLVLILEDLHWADASTIELLATIAQRREPARLLVLGTYRPNEVLGTTTPLNNLVHELQAHHRSVEVPVLGLTEAHVAAYLQQRFPHNAFPTRLPEILYHRTDGTPLFLRNIIDELIAQNTVVQRDGQWILQDDVTYLVAALPDSIRHVVVRQCECLSPEVQQVLAAASVAGIEFSVASVAAALETDVVTVGVHCARLAARQQFLRPAGIAEWPDGTVAARYGFLHILYQHVWHEQVTIEQQQLWHLRIGERKELAYQECESEIASELALHFEQGRAYPRAIYYLKQAAENARQRSANDEVLRHIMKALFLLQPLPRTFP
ncbi:MAG: hypothetical protein FJ147_17090 [Deltaproteobacteria bacterium]|nr:hypothetical protein [Deltaproteobacteria bacterium]